MAKSTVISRIAVASAATPLESSLALWRAGEKNKALDQFAQINWSNSKPAFTPGSSLSRREQDLSKLAPAERERLMEEVNTTLKDLKALASAAREKALGTPEPGTRQQYLKSLEGCGAALNQPQAMLIVKLTGQVIRKMAAQPASAR